LGTVEAEVRELVRRRGLDPVVDGSAMRQLIDEVVVDYDERASTSTLPPLLDRHRAARVVYDAVAGFGPLQRHLDDPAVEEIWINEPGRVFVAKRGRSELTTTILSDGLLCLCQAARGLRRAPRPAPTSEPRSVDTAQAAP
jgi:pilus assembly protein CpaF